MRQSSPPHPDARVSESSPKPGAYFDLDGTIFKSSILEKIVDAGVARNLFASDSFSEPRRLRDVWQRSNNEGVYAAYLRRLIGAFVVGMSGIATSDFNHTVESVVAAHQVRRYSFPLTLMNALRPTHRIIVISGSPRLAVEPFVSDLSVDTVIGSEYEVIDGLFTGQAQGVGDKAAVRRQLINEGLVSGINDVAIGDTMGDASIMDDVTLPIAFNPSATLANYSRAMRWTEVIEVKDNIVVLKSENGAGYSLDSTDNLIAAARNVAR